uniref:Uncharacterized protein n=1 Tax=Rhodosorus marinus TaxID=101924 RepID=A0A7S3E6S1_9RHOD
MESSHMRQLRYVLSAFSKYSAAAVTPTGIYTLLRFTLSRSVQGSAAVESARLARTDQRDPGTSFKNLTWSQAPFSQYSAAAANSNRNLYTAPLHPFQECPGIRSC